MVKQINTDIFLAPTDVIIHQANCHCTMGSGIAKVIKDKYPEVYLADCATNNGDPDKLGTFSYAKVKDSNNPKLSLIINLYSQFSFGLDSRHTSYDAMERGLRAIRVALEAKGNPSKKTVAIPYRMGSDRGGGDWNVVRAIIDSVFHDSVMTVLICDNTGLSPSGPANKMSK